MHKFFVPYSNNKPAAIEIKGHKLLIVSTVREELQIGLTAIGGTKVKEITLNSEADNAKLFHELAQSINGGVVLTPPGIGVDEIIHNLEVELPWLH